MTGRWKKTRVAASGGILLAASWGSAMALFTDSSASSTGAFTTGSVDISSSDVSTTLAMDDMAPGDAVVAPLTVSNGGTLELRYAMSATGAGDASLRSALAVEVRSGVTACSDAGFAADGVAVATGDVDSVAFGDPTSGAHAGDRTLAPGASDDLCVRVSLPTTATSAVQDMTASATFTFSAEQTRNT